MLSREQQREILAVGLMALALFVFVSLLPVSLLGERGPEWFPSGNAMGVVGGALKALLGAFLGGSAILVPPLLVWAGLRSGEWMKHDRALRLGILNSGLLILVPMATWVVTSEPEAAGWVGFRLGAPLVEFVGWLGAILLTGVAMVALSVGTLGWNPLRSVGRGVMAGGEAAGRTAKVLAEKGKSMAEARALAAREAAAAAAAAEPLEETPFLEAVEEDVGAGGLPEPEQESLPAEKKKRKKKESAAPEVPAAPFAEDGTGTLPDPRKEGEEGDLEMPPMELLTAPEERDRADMERQLDELGKVLVEKLGTFNVQCTLGGRTTGPVVTQFEVIPAPGVKVNRIANLDADLALAMKAASVRIVAPIPGKGAVGVEIPNPHPEIVNLRETLETSAFQNAKGELPLALGKDLNGRPYVANLAKMPHVLIAGATGSGKSVCLNTIVTSLVYKHTPETLRLLMIDPKMVELSVYSRLPHLRHNVVTDPRDAAGVLKWAVLEMERRYNLLKVNHVRSIQEFNRKAKDGVLLRRVDPVGPEGDEDRWIYTDGVMPYIVVVVDELADLMMTVQSEVEKPLTQLAQKARAIGIHLIVATQRPSVNVITGLIKANFPTRMAFRVASKTDSRTILDQNGADALLGNGDMLFLPPGQSEPVRIQGAFLPTEDTERLMAWYVDLVERHAEGGEAVPTPSVLERDILEEVRSSELLDAAEAAEAMGGDWDELFRAAAEVCIQNGGGSTSLLQRRLSIGYGRAARIVDQLQDAGVLGPSDGSKGRECLMGLDELDAFLEGGDL
ncbi:MAG TPA: DNA translocase FtsK 4TM domain-containing protein [Longimicrobiales bacterium]|nr:DNA translocase FtsK 4TM domain-containing protein [Longimicrobiales bacterium]